jgi:uronate dehydrogenase
MRRSFLEQPMKRILITGAAGAIGQTLRAGFADAYRPLRLADIRPIQSLTPGEEAVMCDLSDFSAVQSMMQGIDCVVHLGGVPREGPWDAILNSNIVGTYNVFEAARLAYVKRIVFASSNHVIGYHRVGMTVGIEEPPRPDTRYGVSKVFGEALGRLYADKHGLSVACLRIGSFRPRPANERELATWVSPRDLTQLVRRCIDAPEYRYLVFYGVSGNTRARWRNPHAAQIGYAPQDNAEDYAPELALSPENAADPATAFHGGEFCALEFTGEVAAID